MTRDGSRLATLIFTGKIMFTPTQKMSMEPIMDILSIIAVVRKAWIPRARRVMLP